MMQLTYVIYNIKKWAGKVAWWRQRPTVGADGESPGFHKASRENKLPKVNLWLHIRAVALMYLHSHKDKINEKKNI